VKLKIDEFIGSINPTDSEVERKRVWEEFDRILYPIHPIIEILTNFSEKNPDDNSSERVFTHEIKDYMR